MGSFLRRLLGSTLALTMAVLALAGGTVKADGGMTEIVLVHDSHVHGNLESGSTNIAQKAYILNQIRAAHKNVIFVGNGDDLGTSVMSSVFHGRHVIDAFNAMGMEFNTFGNHDFDEGPANTREQIKASRFQWVTANVRTKDGEVFAADLGVRAFAIKEIAGVKIGFTGVAPADTAQITSLGDNVVIDPAKALAEVVPQMRDAGAQVVVVLSHLAGPDAEAVVKQVAGIDIVVGDHAAQILDQPLQIGSTYLSRVGDEYKAVGELHLFIQDGKLDHITFTKHDLKADTAKDEAVAGVVQSYKDQLSASLGEVVAQSHSYLNAMKADNRWRETAMGNVAADIIRNLMKADVALLNGGGVRADKIYAPGPITKGNIQETFPFTNYVVKIEVTGKQLLAALEHAVSQIEKGAGRFAQVSGIAFTYDTGAPVGHRVYGVKVNGKPVDPNRVYTLATVDFIADGGDGYEVFKSAPRLVDKNGGPLLSVAITEGLKAMGTINAHPEGRITIARASFTAGKAEVIVGSSHGMVGTPFIDKGVFYLPVRFVGELYGHRVLWNGNGVDLVRGARVTSLQGVLKDGIYYVPATKLAQALGGHVVADGETITLVMD
jgi:2',3'-cyclic-nucleotide 2'-phosphodiesterase (5'-nucleotidase family)